MSSLTVVILAAGQGKRFRSSQPKSLQPLGGMPLIKHVLATVSQLRPTQVVLVCGDHAKALKACLSDYNDIVWVTQTEPLGTGHALQQALPSIHERTMLLLYADIPLIQPGTLQTLLEASKNSALGVLYDVLNQPQGYGRIRRNRDGEVVGIVEEADCREHERAIQEINTGILALPTYQLSAWLKQLNNHNAQQEYYATDLVAIAAKAGVRIVPVRSPTHWEVKGVNDCTQLAALERIYQRRHAEALLASGVTLLDPDRFELRGTLSCGRDVTIDVNCIFEGHVALGDDVHIGAHCVLKNVTMAQNGRVHPFSYVEGAVIGAHAQIGPYARLRPGTVLGESVRVGNFVEIKQAQVGPASKINHLTYIGDATIGAAVNIGAGTVTCNYNGVSKSQTTIGNRAFIGSNNALIAPVTIGEDATTGAGSVISKNAPAKQLSIARAKQVVVPCWKRPQKERT